MGMSSARRRSRSTTGEYVWVSSEASLAPVRVMVSMCISEGSSSTPASAQPTPHSKTTSATRRTLRAGLQSPEKKRKAKYSAASSALPSMK